MFRDPSRPEAFARRDDLRNPDYLAFAYVSMADAEKNLEDLDGYSVSAEKALEIMERIFREQKFGDSGLIFDLTGRSSKHTWRTA